MTPPDSALIPQEEAGVVTVVTRDDWHRLADAWGVNSGYTLESIAPAGVTCKTCWDWHLCAECLGNYPAECPACDGTGRCHCQEAYLPAVRVVAGKVQAPSNSFLYDGLRYGRYICPNHQRPMKPGGYKVEHGAARVKFECGCRIIGPVRYK